MRSKISRFARVTAEKLAIGITNSRPSRSRCGLRVSECGRDHFESRKLLSRTFDHATKVLDLELRMILIQTFDFEAEASSEIFFVAQHHIDQRREFTMTS